METISRIIGIEYREKQPGIYAINRELIVEDGNKLARAGYDMLCDADLQNTKRIIPEPGSYYLIDPTGWIGIVRKAA